MAAVKMGIKDDDGQDNSGEVPGQALKHDQIDDILRRIYDDVLDDDVPERFARLLDKLREQDAQ